MLPLTFFHLLRIIRWQLTLRQNDTVEMQRISRRRVWHIHERVEEAEIKM